MEAVSGATEAVVTEAGSALGTMEAVSVSAKADTAVGSVEAVTVETVLSEGTA
ncbi:hypothetical protein [Streptomyces daqingensis]|uniref:hypothetical protein n=1 Tax=Streptomyces daqingensis TaxID=1472640 RepID=UPI001E56BC87|nr:hypothetical protein [Streptomyces daqingensis]